MKKIKFLNRVIEKLNQKLPVFYVSTSNFSFDEGVLLSNTWADYIRLDIEHGPFNISGVREFMRGIVGDSSFKENDKLPMVFAELPLTGRSLIEVTAGLWTAHHLLSTGINGLILCHAESREAVQKLVQGIRYPIHTNTNYFSQEFGLRGHGGEKYASKIWGISEKEYIETADLWPLNPKGELMLGVKMENPRAAKHCEEVISVPGVSFGEWGLGDMSLCFGYSERPKFPLPNELASIRKKIWDACNKYDRYFLGISDATNIKEHIDNNMLMIRCYEPKDAEIGRSYAYEKNSKLNTL